MRLIDADALNEKLCNTTIFIKSGEMFQRMINDAPTIEPFTDNISRSQAIKGVSEWATDILHPDKLIKEDAIHILESLPSAEQVTGKLKNPCDSLLTDDSEACKEQKSKLDLISRQDALAEFRDGRDVYDIMESIEELPSAQPNGDLISRQAVIELIKNSYYNLAENMDDVWAMVHDVEQLLSAEVEDRLYIKIYADDEPQDKAEKMYQICVDIAELAEVAKFLKEYCDIPSAPDSRQRGEWVRNHIPDSMLCECDQCGFDCGAYAFNFCPNCGSDMRKGGEDDAYE